MTAPVTRISEAKPQSARTAEDAEARFRRTRSAATGAALIADVVKRLPNAPWRRSVFYV